MKSVRTYNVSQIHKRFQWIQMIITKQKEFYSSLVEIGESFSLFSGRPLRKNKSHEISILTSWAILK